MATADWPDHPPKAMPHHRRRRLPMSAVFIGLTVVALSAPPASILAADSGLVLESGVVAAGDFIVVRSGTPCPDVERAGPVWLAIRPTADAGPVLLDPQPTTPFELAPADPPDADGAWATSVQVDPDHEPGPAWMVASCTEFVELGTLLETRVSFTYAPVPLTIRELVPADRIAGVRRGEFAVSATVVRPGDVLELRSDTPCVPDPNATTTDRPPRVVAEFEQRLFDDLSGRRQGAAVEREGGPVADDGAWALSIVVPPETPVGLARILASCAYGGDLFGGLFQLHDIQPLLVLPARASGATQTPPSAGPAPVASGEAQLELDPTTPYPGQHVTVQPTVPCPVADRPGPVWLGIRTTDDPEPFTPWGPPSLFRLSTAVPSDDGTWTAHLWTHDRALKPGSLWVIASCSAFTGTGDEIRPETTFTYPPAAMTLDGELVAGYKSDFSVSAVTVKPGDVVDIASGAGCQPPSYVDDEGSGRAYVEVGRPKSDPDPGYPFLSVALAGSVLDEKSAWSVSYQVPWDEPPGALRLQAKCFYDQQTPGLGFWGESENEFVYREHFLVVLPREPSPAAEPPGAPSPAPSGAVPPAATVPSAAVPSAEPGPPIWLAFVLVGGAVPTLALLLRRRRRVPRD